MTAEPVSVDTNVREGVELLGYRLEAVLGLGGMGVVYRAVDLRLRRTVALKLMAPELARDERFRARFTRESELAMSLEHPNVIPIHDAGEVDGRLFLAMRLVEGGTLRALLRGEGPLAPARVIAIARQVANALDAAHAKSLVHRDVKPSNVLLDGNEHVYLADFGLTRRLDEQGGRVGDNRSLGTPAYLAPEQIEGGPVDGRADIYSLGCLLYECLAGEPPFAGGSRLAVAWAHLEEEPPAVTARRPDLPGAVDAVLAKAMAKDPAERQTTCTELVADVEHALGLSDHASHRRALVAAAAVALSLLAAALVAILLARGDEQADAATAVTRDSLVHVDPATNSITKAIPVGKVPLETVAVGDTVWVYSLDGTLSEIDASTKAVRRTFEIPLGASFPSTTSGPVLAAGADGAWIVGAEPEGLHGLLVHVLPDGSGIRRFKLDAIPKAVALGGGSVWVLRVDEQRDELLRVDPRSGNVTRRTVLPGFLCPDGGGLAVSNGMVWVMDPRTARLYRVEMASGALIRRDLGNEAARPVFGFGSIWICAANPGSSMLRVDPRTIRARFVTHTIPAEDGTFAIGRGALWRHDEPNGTLLRFEPSGRIAATVRITPKPPMPDTPSLRPTGVAVGPGGVWVTVAHY